MQEVSSRWQPHRGFRGVFFINGVGECMIAKRDEFMIDIRLNN